MIRGARRTIDIEQFYITDKTGEALEPVLEEIRAAGRRGVRVRLLVDLKFFKSYPDRVRELGSQKGIEARSIDLSSTHGVQHAKFFVVDGEDSISGSHNFDWRALSHIHEVSLRVQDKATASDVLRVFESDWAKGKRVGTTTLPPVDIVPSSDPKPESIHVVASPPVLNPKEISPTLPAIESLLQSAKSAVRIQIMTYGTADEIQKTSQWNHLQNAILSAARRGVRVQLMIDAGHVKEAKGDLAALAKAKNVEVRAITIPQWSGGKIDYARLVHSKYLTLDGTQSWIGSENWTEGYFTSSRNLGFVVRSNDVARSLEQIFSKLWESRYATDL